MSVLAGKQARLIARLEAWRAELKDGSNYAPSFVRSVIALLERELEKMAAPQRRAEHQDSAAAAPRPESGGSLPVGVCGKCRANTTFTRDEDYPDILSSACCGFAPLNLPEDE